MNFKTHTVLVNNLSAIEFQILGRMFRYISGNGLFLSGTKITNNTQYIDLYSDIRLVSAANVPFSGIPLTKYEILGDNTINFYLPNNLTPGNYDLVFCGPAGYDKLSNYVDTPFRVVSSL